jgi:hypothetical protein
MSSIADRSAGVNRSIMRVNGITIDRVGGTFANKCIRSA